jgi:hypothetical protein
MRYRRKPHEVDAIKYTGENIEDITSRIKQKHRCEYLYMGVRIITNDDTYNIKIGDYVSFEPILWVYQGYMFDKNYELIHNP